MHIPSVAVLLIAGALPAMAAVIPNTDDFDLAARGAPEDPDTLTPEELAAFDDKDFVALAARSLSDDDVAALAQYYAVAEQAGAVQKRDAISLEEVVRRAIDEADDDEYGLDRRGILPESWVQNLKKAASKVGGPFILRTKKPKHGRHRAPGGGRHRGSEGEGRHRAE